VSHLLLDHLENCKKYLLAYSDAIGIADHKVNLGSAREALIANFLKNNLPKAINYSTGELFDFNGIKSGQLDIVLTPSTAPQLNLFGDYNLIASDTTLGVIEVKSTLTTGKGPSASMSGAMSNCYKVKQLDKVNGGELKLSKSKILLCTVPYLIFAFTGGREDSVLRNIDSHLAGNKKSFKDAPDIIVVLDKGYSLVKHEGWIYAGGKKAKDVYKVIKSEKHALLGLYDFILSVSEHLSTSPEDFKMPLKQYTEKITTFDDLFDW
jgi:hypothetical protein